MYFKLTLRSSSHSGSGPPAAGWCLVIRNPFLQQQHNLQVHMQLHRGCTPGIARTQKEPFVGDERWVCFKTYLGPFQKLLAQNTLGKRNTVDCGNHSSVSWLMRLRALSPLLLLSEKYLASATSSKYLLYLISASSLVLHLFCSLFTVSSIWLDAV